MHQASVRGSRQRRWKRASGASGLFDEIIIDSFAGGGGASMGIERALGRAVDAAVNHDPEAVAMHQLNHPHTLHYCNSVFEVDPLKISGGRPVGLLWASPDCKHFSRAKGAQPVEKGIRDLAWVVVRWAARISPRVIMLENVREFRDWGPLIPKLGKDGKPVLGKNGKPKMVPDPERKGVTFRRWVASLRSLGYAVEWRLLNAADYGAPTSRIRLFVVARRDGEPIVWPESTHGPGRKLYRTAASCIDWSLPCHSIFLSKEEGKRVGVNRPLKPKTMARIAMGLKRFVLENPRPFIVRADHGGDHFRGQDLDEPLNTITTERRHALVTTFLAKHYSGVVGHPPDQPLGTITSVDHHSVVSAFISKGYGDRPDGSSHPGVPADTPLPTITSVPTQLGITATLIKNNHGDKQAFDVEEPLRTVCAGANHHGLVLAFLSKYFGTAIGQECTAPLHTATAKARFGLVTVRGEDYLIADIGLRMLTPRELYLAQGFPPDYRIDVQVPDERKSRKSGRPVMKRLPKSAQYRMVGNSVSPVMSEALVRANFAAECAPIPQRQRRRRYQEASA